MVLCPIEKAKIREVEDLEKLIADQVDLDLQEQNNEFKLEIF